MALDEALFAWSSRTGAAALRVYLWNGAATTVGYFEASRPGLPPGTVRRFTGGGLVEHGEDLTFALALPRNCEAACAPAAERYRWVHEALALVLGAEGLPLVLDGTGRPTGGGPCFAHPVESDLLDARTGRKLGGGAQRRSRGAVLHQGSLRLPSGLRDPRAPWVERFCGEIGRERRDLAPDEIDALLGEGARLERERYATEPWNRPATAPPRV